MGTKTRKTLMAALGVAALAVTPAAFADTGADNHGATDAHPDQGNHGAANNGHHGDGNNGNHGGQGKGKDPVVAYVFKGTYSGDGSTVAVDHGNRHARRAELVDTTVAFDLSAAKVTVADTNADGATDLSDVAAGDRVVVIARLPKSSPGDAPYAARRLVDQTNPAPEPAPTP